MGILTKNTRAVLPLRPSPRVSAIMGPIPSFGELRRGPAWAQGWYDKWIAAETSHFAAHLATNSGNVDDDWIPVGQYDRAHSYLSLYYATGNALYRTRAQQCADKYNLHLANVPALYNSYVWGPAAVYALTGSPSNFPTILANSMIPWFSNGYYWNVLNTTANQQTVPDTGLGDGRSTARLLQGALLMHVLGVAFPSSGLHAPVQALGSWAAVCESIVDTILATQNAAGGWHFRYNGSAAYVKCFMNALLCHALYDYTRILPPSASRLSSILDAVQGCADWLWTNAWVGGNPSTTNQEVFRYCWPDVSAILPNDAPFPAGDNQADLIVEIAWIFAWLDHVGRTRAGATAGVDTYPDIVRRCFAKWTNVTSGGTVGAPYGKQQNEGAYRAIQSIVFSVRRTQSIPVAPPVAPVNTVSPVVSGTTQVGQTLSVTTGTWTGTAPITYTYQWRRDGTPISGATASTYALVTADLAATMTCAVTATNAAGNTTAVSNAVGPVTSGASAMTWSPTDKSSGIVLSNGNLTATRNAGYYSAVRGSSALSGKRVWRIRVDLDGILVAGIATAAQGLTGADDDTNTFAYKPGSQQISKGGVYYTDAPAGGTGTWYQDFAIDTANNLAWIGVNGTWQGNPAAGTGGWSITSGQTFYPYLLLINEPNSPIGTLINADGTGLTPPSGFSWIP